MFRLAGLGDEAILVGLEDLWILVGCPPDAGRYLSELGVQPQQVTAVLVTSGASMDGWPLFCRLCPERPQLFGTEPMLQAAQGHLRDLAMSKRKGELFSTEEVDEVFAAAKEVSYRQELLLETEKGPVIAMANCSGLGLGGSFWTLEFHSLSLAVGAIGDFRALKVDVAALLGGVPAAAASVEQQITDLVREAVKLLALGGRLLVPLRSAVEAHAAEVTEQLAKAISALESPVPIFAVGTVARGLRRCGRFAEWSCATRQARAHRGEHPFLVEPLVKSGRLFLTDSLNELQAVYEEPCVVLASPLLASHFEHLWASKAGAHCLGCQSSLPGAGKPLQVYMDTPELEETLAGASPQLFVPRPLLTQAPKATELPKSLLELKLDLSRCKAKLWLPRELIAAARKQGRKRPADVLPLHATLLGSTRPRLAPRHAEEELLAGSVNVEALRSALLKEGLSLEGHGEALEIRALDARIFLNQPTATAATALETVVECNDPEGRRRIAEVLESVLMAF